MTADEAIDLLDVIDGSDPEAAHAKADRILLEFVPEEVSEAYEQLIDRADAWWYA